VLLVEPFTSIRIGVLGLESFDQLAVAVLTTNSGCRFVVRQIEVQRKLNGSRI